MKIAYCSDLHLEFGDLVLENENDADVLILAGDILITEHLRRYQKHSPCDNTACITNEQRKVHRYQLFIDRISEKFQDIIVVAGNHEYYFGIWSKDIEFLRELYNNYGNIHFLEMDHVILGGITFTGGTLWTDCNGGDAHTICEMTIRMNDYQVVSRDQYRDSTLTPADTSEHHHVTMEYLKKVLEQNLTEQYVVVGHHAPSPLSSKTTSKKRSCINGAYSSDLSGFIENNRRIACWVHGHVHRPVDYMIGATRIVCNPRGYIGHQKIADNFRLKYINI